MRLLIPIALLLMPSLGDAADPQLAERSTAYARSAELSPAYATQAGTAPLVREHPDEVASYTLSVVADPAHHQLAGSGVIRFKNTTDKALTSLWLHLYLNAFKNERSVFLREPTGAFRGSSRPKSWGTIDVRKFRDGEVDIWDRARFAPESDGDETDVELPLETPIAAHTIRSFEMTWESTLPSIVERTGFADSFHFAGQWFPKLAKLEPDGTFAHFPFHHLGEFYADFGRYDVTISVPKAFRIGATGSTVEASEREGRRIERHVQNDVHDFAFTFWDRFQERTETIAGVKVLALFPPGYDALIERELKALRFAIPHFGERYGPYPYPVLTVVHPPSTDAAEAGGMEYPTLITTGGAWYTPSSVRTPELVTIHEFGHQYFFGLLASNEHRFPFLDEGLNSYAELESMGAWLGDASAGSLLGLDVSITSVQAAAARDIGQDEPVADSAPQFLSGRHYGRLVYSRTAAILETLRRVYGNEAMQRTMRSYALRFRFAHPNPSDFLSEVARELGDDARKLLQLALFEKGWVDYQIAQVTRGRIEPAAGIFDAEGKRETRSADAEHAGHSGTITLVRRGTIQLPIDVDVAFEGGAHETLHWDGEGPSVRLRYENAARLESVRLDPEHRILLDEVATNNHYGAPGSFAKSTDYAAFISEALWRLFLP
jgi:Peptidase family M1 domain